MNEYNRGREEGRTRKEKGENAEGGDIQETARFDPSQIKSE